MAREHNVQVRLSDREDEMLQELQEQSGTTNASEGMRFALAYAHTELVLKPKKFYIGKDTQSRPYKLLPWGHRAGTTQEKE